MKKISFLLMLWLVYVMPFKAVFAQWDSMGPGAIPKSWGGGTGPSGAGKLQAFAVDFADPQIMYAGGGAGPGNSGPYGESGVFNSTDGGLTWTPADSGLTDPMVDVLWLDQSDPEILLAGTWFKGIFRSTDAGVSWTPVTGFGSTTAFLQVAQTLYAATQNGIAASTDAGKTWKMVESTPSPARALAASGTALYAGLDNGDVLFQSSPTSSWQNVRSDPGHTVWSLAVDPDSSQIAYVVEWDNYQSPDLFVTHNSGGSWSTLTAPSGNAVQVVAVDSFGTVYAAPGGSFYSSTDDGATWSTVSQTTGDNRFIMPWPGVRGKIVLGSDQGLAVTTDSGSSWVSLNGNIKSSLLTGLAVHDSTILTAVQDYSPIASFDGGATWHEFWGSAPPVGEDGIVKFNPANPSYAYEYTGAGFYFSADSGHTFKLIPSIQFTLQGGPNMISVDPKNPSTVYAVAKDGIYESTDWGNTWAKLSWSFTTPSLVVVSPFDSRTIFVGAQGVPGLWVTHDDGSTWSQCNLGGAGGYPVALGVDPTDSSIIEVGMSFWTGGIGGVLLSRDGGNTFVGYSSGLDQTQMAIEPYYASALIFRPDSENDEAALATWNGIYLSPAPGLPWINITGNCVSRYVTGLAWANGYLYASTWGEGVVRRPESALFTVSPPILLSPANDAAEVAVSPTMEWHSSAGATGYELQVSNDSTFITTVLDTSGLADTTCEVRGLSPFTKYFWRVDAASIEGNSGWSNVSSFTTTGKTILRLQDDFTKDTALNSNLWIVNGPVGKTVGIELSNPPDSVIVPTISFSDTGGLGMSGVDSLFQAATIQSVNPFNPPFTVQAQCFASVGYAIPYGLAIASGDGGEGIAIVGDYAAQYEGVWDQISQGTGNLWSNFLDEVFGSPELNVRYQLTIAVDSSDTAELAISSGGQTLGQVSRSVGAGPFYVLIYQREGWPPVPGPNQAYWQWINVTSDSITGIMKTGNEVPLSYGLGQNYPNPFNPTTTIDFALRKNSTVELSVFNVLGQRVQTFDLGRMNAGTYSQVVDMSRFASGVYFYRIEALASDGGRFVSTKKMVLLK